MLDKLFSPASVAVIGASQTPGKVGHDVLRNLLQGGFAGRIFPVNPRADQILGLPAVPSVESIPEPVDLAIVAVPAAGVLAVVEACGQKGIRLVVILSAGFREAGAEGIHLERDVLEVARRHGIRIVGPNCLGVMDTNARLNATFAAAMPPQGSIGFFSQSGALCLAVLDWAAGTGVGLSHFVSLGNKADVSDAEMLEAMEGHDETRVILGYLEGVDDGRRLMETASLVSRRKPIVLLKSGSTAAGARAASSHTGSLAGSAQAFAVACRQSGIVQVRTLREFLNLALGFALQKVPAGGNVAVITNSGGPGILAADACDSLGLQLPTLTQETVATLRGLLPPMASLYNPMDVLGDAQAERYSQVLDVVVRDPSIHAIMVLLTPTAMLDVPATARVIARVAKRSSVTVLACFMGEARVAEGRRILMEGGVPSYETPEEAAEVLRSMWGHRLWLERPEDRPATVKRDLGVAREVVDKVQASGHQNLSPVEVTRLLAAYGIRLPRSAVARTADESVTLAKEFGYPIVLKVASSEISHKSDLGGVRVDLRSAEEVRSAFQDITAAISRLRPEARLLGVQVQEMITEAREVIVGFQRDPDFGPLLMFGLGGIYVEVLRDVTFRVAPLSRLDIREMLREVHAFPLLQGIRGQPPADLPALETALAAITQLALDFPEIEEGEINPLMVCRNGQGVTAVDARFILRGSL